MSMQDTRIIGSLMDGFSLAQAEPTLEAFKMQSMLKTHQSIMSISLDVFSNSSKFFHTLTHSAFT